MIASEVPLGIYAFSSDGEPVGKVVRVDADTVWLESDGERIRLRESDLLGITTGDLALTIDAATVDRRPHNVGDADGA